MNQVWLWIIVVFVLTLANIIGYSFGVKCSNENNYNEGEKKYMSTLLGINVVVFVCSLAGGAFMIYA